MITNMPSRSRTVNSNTAHTKDRICYIVLVGQSGGKYIGVYPFILLSAIVALKVQFNKQFFLFVLFLANVGIV